MLPSWLWIGTRLKFSLWVTNRLLTWTGGYYVWKRFRARRDFWVWIIPMNVVSFVALGGLLYWPHLRRVH